MSEEAAVRSQESEVSSENALIRPETKENTTKKDPVVVVYDAEAKNRFEFTVRMGSKKYETAHVFKALSDERYLKWLREWHIKGREGEEVSEEAREATVRLWNDTIDVVEKIKYPDGSDWRDLISANEKIESMNKFLAVAISDDDVELVEGERNFGVPDETQSVRTETWFNNEIAVQTHELKLVNMELHKKYSRIEAKRFKQEATRGLRRKPRIEFIPQDDKLGELYDEMFVSQQGFANDTIPLRFKVMVVHHLFEEQLDQKKSDA